MSFDVEGALRRMRRTALISVAVSALASLPFGFGAFLGAASGGVLALLNLEVLSKLSARLTATKPSRVSWLGAIGLLFRYILLCLALFVIISVWRANVLALALGFSVPLAAVVVDAGLLALRESKAEHETNELNDNAEA